MLRPLVASLIVWLPQKLPRYQRTIAISNITTAVRLSGAIEAPKVDLFSYHHHTAKHFDEYVRCRFRGHSSIVEGVSLRRANITARIGHRIAVMRVQLLAVCRGS